jgi:hypothetical protein
LVEEPSPWTLGDDLESFALVLLRLVGRHAPNNVERHNFLQRFVGFYGCYKSVMFGVGRAFVPRLKLHSDNLTYLLEDLLDGCQY